MVRVQADMIALSSARPFSQSPEYTINQERASKSWQEHYNITGIFYVGHYEDGLNGDKVQFVKPEEDFPRIKMMAEFASHMTSEYVALINADIVLGSGIVDVEAKMRECSLPAATSYRYEFTPEDYPSLDGATRHKEDRGMDIFIAHPGIWKLVAKDVPDDLWFGHQTWDSWVCGYFCHHLGFGFRHFTEDRCVFHPKHGGRQTPNSPRIKNDSPYFTRAKRPSPL